MPVCELCSPAAGVNPNLIKMKLKLFYTCALFLLCGSIVVQAQQPASDPSKPYKYVIKGGHIIDPKNNIDEVMDIAITGGRTPAPARDAVPARPASDGRTMRPAEPAQEAITRIDGFIALVAKNIDPSLAVQVIDASGLYVTPGFIDIHTHNFWGTDIGGFNYRNGPYSIPPDGFTFPSGVTTVVDAGSSGWRNFETFKKQTIDLSFTRVLALLNINGEGMNGRSESNLDDMDALRTGEMGKKYPEHIVGVKNAHFVSGMAGIPNDFLLPVERGIQAAEMMKGVFMLDGRLDAEIFKRFRPGDIYTHVYGRAIVDSAGNIKPFVLEARKKGIIFDVGFGGASFGFNIATPALKHGFFPNSISSDQHRSSMNNAMKDMQNIMGLFMGMGMPFKEVIKASTWNPAQQIRRPDLGHLSVGAVADIAIFGIREGKFGFWARDGYIDGTKRFDHEMTIRSGDIVYNLNGRVKPINLPPLR